MTECERLVSEGFISEDFLREEVRNDFTVSADRKKEWAVYLDILREIGKVCGELGLRYWVGFGSMLGAVRHGGFIPWDDDIDVFMPRDDYDRLLEHPDAFSEPYFLRTPQTDKDFYYSYAGVCNCNTTSPGINGSNPFHRGMSVSLIPLDGLPKSDFIAKLRCKRLKLMSVIGHAYALNINPNPVLRFLHKFLRLPFVPFSTKRLFAKANRIARKTKWEDTERVGLTIYSACRYERTVFQKKDFAETVEMPFENLRVNVPKGYDGILKVIYRNYMEFPPVEKRIGRHETKKYPDIPCSVYYGEMADR